MYLDMVVYKLLNKKKRKKYDVLKTFRPIVLLNTMDNVIKWFYSIKWFYHFLSILSLRNNGLSSSLIQLSYENTFYLIWGILSILLVFDLVVITLRFKGGHMVNTCQTHVGHMLSICTTVHCCAMLYAQPFILYYSFLFTSLTQPFIQLAHPLYFTYQSCIPLTNLCYSCLLVIVISFTHCMCIFDS